MNLKTGYYKLSKKKCKEKKCEKKLNEHNLLQLWYNYKKVELKSLWLKVKGEWKGWLETKVMASSPITSWQIDGGKWKQWQILFSWAPKSLQILTAAMKLKSLASWEKSYDKLR